METRSTAPPVDDVEYWRTMYWAKSNECDHLRRQVSNLMISIRKAIRILDGDET